MAAFPILDHREHLLAQPSLDRILQAAPSRLGGDNLTQIGWLFGMVLEQI